MTPLERVRDLARVATREQLRDALLVTAEAVDFDTHQYSPLFDAEDIGGALCDAMCCGDAIDREGCAGLCQFAPAPCPVLSLLPSCPDIGADDGGPGAEDRRKHLRAEALWLRVGGEES